MMDTLFLTVTTVTVTLQPLRHSMFPMRPYREYFQNIICPRRKTISLLTEKTQKSFFLKTRILNS